MENRYEQIYAHNRENYNRVLADYTAIIDTPEYKDAIYGTPFIFLGVLYLAKRIDFYTMAEAGKKPSFDFDYVQEALCTYNNIMNFPEIVADLLDKASLVVQADTIAEKINNYVKLSDYLDDNLAVQRNTMVAPIARECLTVLPKAMREITPELRYDLLKDMLNKFSEKQIGALAAKDVFKKEDIDTLTQICVTDKAKKNIKMLCDGFGLKTMPIKSVDLNLKGVTFKNDDGSLRQDYIKELDEYIKTTGEHPALTITPYIYHPQIGAPEAAASVSWGDKCLGNLPREVAIQVHNEYADKVMAAKVINVVGGDDVAYGVKIDLAVCEKVIPFKNEKAEKTDSVEQDRDIS